MDAVAKKAALRKEMLSKRALLPDEERRIRSKKICESFLDGSEYRKAETILLYRAYNSEVDTDLIFERAVSDKKTVAYPVSAIKDGKPEMLFYVVNDMEQFKRGFKGIPEPDTLKGCRLFDGIADVCVAPVVAFDGNCNRIGYGKGFYDAYLRKSRPKAVTGLAYDIQATDGIEPEECDIPADIVITETKVYRRKKDERCVPLS